MILGVHFTSLLDIKFPWMTVSYTHLDRWLGIERFVDDDDGNPGMKPFEGVGVPVSDDFHILFYPAAYEEVGANQSPYHEVLIAEIVPEEIMPFYSSVDEDEHDDDAFFPYIDRYLRDFLNLVTGEPNYPFNITAVSPYESEQLVKIYYRIPGFDRDARRRVEVSFTFAHQFIESRFASLLKTWIEKSRYLRSACDLYFKRYFLSNIDVETRFLFLIQAVEAYHRSLHKDVYIEPEDYEPIREILELVITFQVKADFVQSWSDREYDANIVESLMNKLNDTIEHGNQYSLRKRLNVIRNDILKGNENIVKELLENPFGFRKQNCRN